MCLGKRLWTQLYSEQSPSCSFYVTGHPSINLHSPKGKLVCPIQIPEPTTHAIELDRKQPEQIHHRTANEERHVGPVNIDNESD